MGSEACGITRLLGVIQQSLWLLGGYLNGQIDAFAADPGYRWGWASDGHPSASV